MSGPRDPRPTCAEHLRRLAQRVDLRLAASSSADESRGGRAKLHVPLWLPFTVLGLAILEIPSTLMSALWWPGGYPIRRCIAGGLMFAELVVATVFLFRSYGRPLADPVPFDLSPNLLFWGGAISIAVLLIAPFSPLRSGTWGPVAMGWVLVAFVEGALYRATRARQR